MRHIGQIENRQAINFQPRMRIGYVLRGAVIVNARGANLPQRRAIGFFTFGACRVDRVFKRKLCAIACGGFGLQAATAISAQAHIVKAAGFQRIVQNTAGGDNSVAVFINQTKPVGEG